MESKFYITKPCRICRIILHEPIFRERNKSEKFLLFAGEKAKSEIGEKKIINITEYGNHLVSGEHKTKTKTTM